VPFLLEPMGMPKGALQDRHGLDEAAAYRWIQRTSMDRRMSMREVAELVVAELQPPPAPHPA